MKLLSVQILDAIVNCVQVKSYLRFYYYFFFVFLSYFLYSS